MNDLTAKEQRVVRTALRVLRLRVGAWDRSRRPCASTGVASSAGALDGAHVLEMDLGLAALVPRDLDVMPADERQWWCAGAARPARLVAIALVAAELVAALLDLDALLVAVPASLGRCWSPRSPRSWWPR